MTPIRGEPQDRSSPPRAGDRPVERSVPVRAAVRGAAFRWLTAAFVLNAVGNVAVFVHLVPYLTDRGYGASFAASVASLVGVMALPGRLIFTPLGDRVPRSLLTAFIFMLQAVALAALMALGNTAGVWAFVVLFGAGFGAITPMRAALVAEYYGPAHYGSISGVLMLFVTGARAAGPVLAGAAYDLGDTYDPILWALTMVSALAAGAVLMAERSIEPATSSGSC